MSYPYQKVLGGVYPLAGCNFKDEIRKKEQAQKEKDVFEGSVDGLVGVGYFDERNPERRGFEPIDGVARSFGTHAAGDEGY